VVTTAERLDRALSGSRSPIIVLDSRDISHEVLAAVNFAAGKLRLGAVTYLPSDPERPLTRYGRQAAA
jgi:hypothetical protein